MSPAPSSLNNLTSATAELRGGSSLTSRVIKSASWVLAGKLAGRGLELIRIVVLARLLLPDDFGLLGIAMLALATSETFTHTGFNKALIQRKGDIAGHLNTAWTIQIIRGLLLAALLYSIAPWIAWFFNEPRAIPVLRVLSFMEVLRGGLNIGIVYFHKNLEFHKQVAYETASQIVALVIGVVLAYRLRNVWALVWAGLAGEFVRMALSYVLHPYRPRLAMDWKRAGQLFDFGKWFFGITVLNFLATKANRMILGRLLGTTALGVFNLADRIGNKLPMDFKQMTDSVMVPAYARVQDDQARVERGFLQAFNATLYITGPISAVIFVTAPALVLSVLGGNWSAAIVPLRILTVAGLLHALIGAIGALYIGLGHPKFGLANAFLGSAAILASIYPLTNRLGVAGAALATVFGALAKIPVSIIAMKTAAISPKRLASASIPGFTLTIAAGLGAMAGTQVADIPLYSLAVQLFASGLAMVAAIYTLGRFGCGPWNYIVKIYERTKTHRATA